MDAVHPNLREYNDDDDGDFYFLYRSTLIVELDNELLPQILMEHVFLMITQQPLMLVDIEQQPIYCTWWMYKDGLFPNCFVFKFYFFRKGQ